MDISNVMQDIKSGSFKPFYIFYGEEWYVEKQYVSMISKKSGFKLMYMDSIESLFAKISQKSLLDCHYVYVIMNDRDFLTNEKAWDAVGDGRRFKDDIVIFQFTDCDGRLKFWKKHKDLAVEFKKLDESVLIKRIKKEIQLSDDNCRRLAEACDGDLGRIMLEIDKIQQYGERSQAINEDRIFELLLKDGTIYRPPKDAIFDFVNAVLEREPRKAFDLLMQSYAVGEANMVLLSVLYNSARTLLLVQSGKKNLGLNGWAVKNVLPYKGCYRNGELVKLMSLIREAEKGIKTGTMTDEISVQSILVQIM